MILRFNMLCVLQVLKEFRNIDVDVYIVSCDGEFPV